MSPPQPWPITEFWWVWLLLLYYLCCNSCAAFIQYNFLYTCIIIESWIFACFLLCCFLPPPQLFRGNYNNFKYFAYAARQSRKFIWQTGLQLSARKQSGENTSNNFSMSMSGSCSEHTKIMHKEEEFYIYSFNKAESLMKIMYFLSSHPKLNYKTLLNNWKPKKVNPLLQIISHLQKFHPHRPWAEPCVWTILQGRVIAEQCYFPGCSALRFNCILSSLQLILKLVNTYRCTNLFHSLHPSISIVSNALMPGWIAMEISAAIIIR